MADEWTMSIITWLNTRLRARQSVATLMDQVQIALWAKYGPDVSLCFLMSNEALMRNQFHQAPPPAWKEVEVKFQDLKPTSKATEKDSRIGLFTDGASPGDNGAEATEEDEDNDSWSDTNNPALDDPPLGENRRTLDVLDLFDLLFYKIQDHLAADPVAAPACEVSEVEAIFPRNEPACTRFVFSLK